MPDAKLVIYLANDPAWDWVITGDMDGLLDYVKSYANELGDGETIEIEIKRHDMTQEEIDSAPEQ
jgi:hypothetical protein